MKNTDGRVDGNHCMVYTSADIFAHLSVQLTRGGLILIGLLSGGDYHPAGLAHCGPRIAHGLAKCGFGDDLLKAAQSLPRNELPDFLTTWREDLRGELRTNSRGHLSSKKPSLAKAVLDSFPNIDVLLSYTNPIISATDASACLTHAPPQWEHEPDLGRLAHLCELHFEWGLKDIIIKRFRTIIWPSIVLRALRRSTLEAAASLESCSMPGAKEREPLQDVFGTPSKLVVQHFSSMGLGAHSAGDGDGSLQELIVKIHGSRMHASTDNILEYRLEVAPAQLVHLASAGIQGLRKPADTTYDVQPSESEEESGRDVDIGDMGKRRKKHCVGPPLDPESHLRMWMPACMVRPVLPDLVKRFETELEAKCMKSLSSKRKVIKLLAPPMDSNAEEFDLNVSHSSGDEEGEGSSLPPRTCTQAVLPAASLDHSQHPDTIWKHLTPSSQNEQILDITTSDDDDNNRVDEAGPSKKKEVPLLSTSKVLQRLDFDLKQDINLCGALPLTVSSPPGCKRPSPPSTLQPFPMAFEEELSNGDNKKGYLSNTGTSSNYSTLQTPFAAFHTLPRASMPPPPPQKGKPHMYPPMVVSAAASSQQEKHVSSSCPPTQTLPQQQLLQRHLSSPPPAKKARKGGSLEEGQILHMQGGGAAAAAAAPEMSIISISSNGSDSDSDDDNNNLVF